MKSVKLNQLFLMMATVVAPFFITSCGGDDDSPEPTENTATACADGVDNDGDGLADCDDSDCQALASLNCGTTLTGSVGTTTLDASKVYIIDRFAYVDDGDVLTIPAGTILKANDGQGADASALIVARGGKIIAQGTADKPIVFTSINDDIQPGETTSTLNPLTLSEGQWGGLIILGKAPVSVKPADSADGVGKEGYIEGVPASNSFAAYGGDNATDNSGILDYVSIRYTGSTLSTDEEIQGLTLGGVGSGTSISNIEIFSSFDDGVEFFGGSVNIDNLLVAYQTDDAIDIDQSYAGIINNSVVLLYNPSTGNDGMEIDGPEASGVNDGGEFTVKNVTIYQKGGANVARLKSSAQGTIDGLAAKGFSGQTLLLDGASSITVQNSEFNEAESVAITQTDVDVFHSVNNVFSVTSFTKGADESAFAWTFTKERGDF